MKYLLDINLLIAGIWANHLEHVHAFAWLEGKSLVICPLSELGFLRISTNQRAINAPMEQARELLQRFLSERKVIRIQDDLPALESHPQTSAQVTDHYLAALAGLHGYKLATFDAHIQHKAVEVVS